MTNPSTRIPVAVVADDEDLGRLLLAESAGAAGLHAVAVDNGIDALQAALRENVGMVLLDVDMPGLDGFEVCRRIRAARGASLPVVMVTGLDDKTAVDRAFQAGATDFISKPVNWTLLPHRLAYIVRNSEREARIVTLVDAIPDALWVVSADGEPRWSKADGATLQPAEGDARSTLLVDSVPRERLPELLSGIAATARDGSVRMLDVRHETPDDAAPRFSEIRLSRVEGGDVLVVLQDTTDRALSAARIEKLAFFDGLTGLPNRQHCLERTSRFLERANREGEGLALLYIDLNSFKRINDTFGHSVGDVILQKVGAVLSTLLQEQCRGDSAFLARLGGDEFVVVVQEKDARAAAIRTAEEIRSALATPIRYDTLEFIAAPSIGTAAFPEDGTDLETLLRHADTAMYQAKAAGGPKIIAYQPVMSARLRDALELENHLRKALRDNALDIRFQPKFRLKDGALVGAEALVRWFDADFGEISPNRFVPVAEESGLIVDMGAWIMRAVCRRLGVWHQSGIAIPIAVNVSGKELLFADPSKLIKAEAEQAGIPAGLIEAEITESVFVTDLTTARSSVNKIRELGCRIALDDFGTGYSSLSYLTRFPPDRLKIDRSFISNVDRSQNDGAIVKAIMSLARSLNLLVTAEGIERQGQLDWLRSHGCDEVQGYLLARPLSAAEMESRFLRPEAQMVAWRMAR